MTTDDTKQIAAVIRANRFHFGAPGIRALADLFETTVPKFDRSIFYYQVDRTQKPTLGPCYCRLGQERDNCPSCEGSGKRLDFAKMRAS